MRAQVVKLARLSLAALLPLAVLMGVGRVPAAPSESPDKAAAGKKSKVRQEDKTLQDFDKNCVRPGCHAQLVNKAWVHAPTGANDCGVCHEAVNAPASHKFKIARPKEKLCTFCHVLPEHQRVIHKPYGDSECTACHDPHGGDTHFVLRSEQGSELCTGRCHDPGKHPDSETQAGGAAFKVIHKPVAEGKCLACHSPHQSRYDSLLLAPDEQMCWGCHSKLKERMTTLANTHDPVTKGCKTCHLPHAGNVPRLLRKPSAELCISCHEPEAAFLKENGRFHGSEVSKDYCIACHEPHASSSAKLVKDPVTTACFACHDRDITLLSGRKIPNVKALVTPPAHGHGNRVKGQCLACHHGHSSPHASLLVADYPKSAYVPFSKDAYSLCFSCHDRRMVNEERTALTGFRDGDRNLHYVHVHRERGRSCLICHDAHGTKSPKLVRRGTSYGPQSWRLPIGFRETPTGGSCSSGCHKKQTYDNRNPPASGNSSSLLPTYANLPGPEGDGPSVKE